MERPSTGATIAVALTLCALAALGWTAALVGPTALAAGAGAAFVGTGLLGSRDELPLVALASLGYVVAVAAGLLALGAGAIAVIGGVGGDAAVSGVVSSGWQSLCFSIAVAVAAFGAFSLPSQSRLPERSRAIVVVGTYVFGVFSTAAMVASVLGAGFAPLERAVDVGGVLADGALAPSTGVPSLGTFLLTFAAAAVATAAALGRAPVAVFVDRERRDAVRSAVGRASGHLVMAALLAAVPGFVFTQLPADVWGDLRSQLPGSVYDILLAVTTNALLRAVLVCIAALAVATVIAVWIARRLRIESLRGPARIAARGFGGFVVLGAVLAIGPDRIVGRLLEASPLPAATAIEGIVAGAGATGPTLLLLVAAFGIVWIPIGLLGLLGKVRIVPPRTAGAVLAGLGIGAATIACGLLEGPSVLLVGTLTLALVVWDVGSYDRRLEIEIGSVAPSRRPELVHGGATLAVGVAVTAAVYGLAAVIPALVNDATTAGIAALVAVILLLGVLRG